MLLDDIDKFSLCLTQSTRIQNACHTDIFSSARKELGRKFVVMTNLTIHRARIQTHEIEAAVKILRSMNLSTNIVTNTARENTRLDKGADGAAENVFSPLLAFLLR